jgi:hypothetical protein
MRIDPRAGIAVVLAILAFWLAAPREDALLIPKRRRGPLEWLRYRLGRADRDRQEEREATRFFARVRDPEPQVYQIRRRDLPSANRRIETALLADYADQPPSDAEPPWGGARASFAPDPRDPDYWAQVVPQDLPQDEAQEPPPSQENPLPPLADLRAWAPGDPGPAPTGVIQKITPQIERELRPYLDGLPGYEDEPGQ